MFWITGKSEYFNMPASKFPVVSLDLSVKHTKTLMDLKWPRRFELTLIWIHAHACRIQISPKEQGLVRTLTHSLCPVFKSWLEIQNSTTGQTFIQISDLSCIWMPTVPILCCIKHLHTLFGVPLERWCHYYVPLIFDYFHFRFFALKCGSQSFWN